MVWVFHFAAEFRDIIGAPRGKRHKNTCHSKAVPTVREQFFLIGKITVIYF